MQTQKFIQTKSIRPPIKTVWIIVLLVSNIFPPNWCYALPLEERVPGGIALIDLTQAAGDLIPYFKGRRIMVASESDSRYAVVGIPLTTKPGEHQLELRHSNGNVSRKISFEVQGKNYRSQYITIKDKRKVEPNAEDLKRIRSDSKAIRAALNHWDDQIKAPLQFSLPVNGRQSSEFGLRRFFNQQARKPHSGLDLAADRGTPVGSPTHGKVIATGDYFFNGNTVFLDHGQGLVTMYCHLDSIAVKPGQFIKRGQTIGTVGSSGRATGPHLHWSISLNRTMVNPILFLPPPQTTDPQIPLTKTPK